MVDLNRRLFLQILGAAAVNATLPKSSISTDVVKVKEMIQYDKLPHSTHLLFTESRRVIDIDGDIATPITEEVKLLIDLIDSSRNLNSTTLNQTLYSVIKHQISNARGSGVGIVNQMLEEFNESSKNVSISNFVSSSKSQLAEVLREILDLIQKSVVCEVKMVLDQKEFNVLEKILDFSELPHSTKPKIAKEIYRLNTAVIDKILSEGKNLFEKLPDFENEIYKSTPEDGEIDYESLLPKKPFLEGFDFDVLQRVEKLQIMKPKKDIDYKRRRLLK